MHIQNKNTSNSGISRVSDEHFNYAVHAGIKCTFLLPLSIGTTYKGPPKKGHEGWFALNRQLTEVSDTTSTSDTMHILLYVVGKVKVHNVLHIRDVETTCCHLAENGGALAGRRA